MAQYTARPTTIEAHKTNSARVPAWYTAALKARTIHPVIQESPGAFAQTGIAVKTFLSTDYIQSGDYVIRHPNGNFTTAPADTFEANYILDEADLLTVLAETGDPDSLTWAIEIANTDTEIGLTDITITSGATFKLYSDAALKTQITGGDTIALEAGKATPVYIKVTSQNGNLVRLYTVNITRKAA